MEPAGVAHVASGLASLVLGGAVFTSRKGGNLHRALGALYVLAMFGLNLTAFTIYRLFDGFGIFHVLALGSLLTVLAGFAVVLLKRPRGPWLHRHYFYMGWSYDLDGGAR